MLFCNEFSYTPAFKTLDSAEENPSPAVLMKALVGFIHIEPKDVEDIHGREKKLVNTLKWAARKNETNTVVLHSFAHLAEEKADAESTKELLDRAEVRLRNGGYGTAQTPFGYFLDLHIDAPGHTFARLFKEL